MNKTIPFVLMSFAILASCVSEPRAYITPTAEQIAAADFGAYPEKYDEAIRIFMQTYLKDPSSAQYRYVGEPTKAWNLAYDQEGLRYFYTVKAFVNAKNSYGGYIGEHEYIFKIRDGVCLMADDVTAARENLIKAGIY